MGIVKTERQAYLLSDLTCALFRQDDVSPSTIPVDALHRYYVRVKGIETNPLPEREVTGERIKEGNVIWVKKPCSKCTT